MTYLVRQPRLLATDESWVVCWRDRPSEVEATFPTRIEAEEHADVLGDWVRSKPIAGEPSVRFASATDPPVDFGRIEPAEFRLLEAQRERLRAAQSLLADAFGSRTREAGKKAVAAIREAGACGRCCASSLSRPRRR